MTPDQHAEKAADLAAHAEAGVRDGRPDALQKAAILASLAQAHALLSQRSKPAGRGAAGLFQTGPEPTFVTPPSKGAVDAVQQSPGPPGQRLTESDLEVVRGRAIDSEPLPPYDLGLQGFVPPNEEVDPPAVGHEGHRPPDFWQGQAEED